MRNKRCYDCQLSKTGFNTFEILVSSRFGSFIGKNVALFCNLFFNGCMGVV